VLLDAQLKTLETEIGRRQIYPKSVLKKIDSFILASNVFLRGLRDVKGFSGRKGRTVR
jgi:hypothetical protein